MSLRELEPKDVYKAIQDGKAVLIDVREPGEFGSERIHGASLHPLSTFDPAALPVDRDARGDLPLRVGQALDGRAATLPEGRHPDHRARERRTDGLEGRRPAHRLHRPGDRPRPRPAEGLIR